MPEVGQFSDAVDTECVALADRLAEKLHERRVDAWVRDASGREKKPHACLLYVAVMTLSSRAARSGAGEYRPDTVARLIAVATPQAPYAHRQNRATGVPALQLHPQAGLRCATRRAGRLR